MGIKITGVKAEGRAGDVSDFVIFDISDIYYIELARPSKNTEKRPLFRTNHGSYFAIGTLEGLSFVLQNQGITYLDSTNLVNIDNISYIEETQFYTKAHFADGTYATVSQANMHKVKNIPRKL